MATSSKAEVCDVGWAVDPAVPSSALIPVPKLKSHRVESAKRVFSVLIVVDQRESPESSSTLFPQIDHSAVSRPGTRLMNRMVIATEG